jgi:hypothetical protein
MPLVSLNSAYRKTVGLKILAEENLKKKIQLIAVKPRYNATSDIAHTTLWTSIPSYILCRITDLQFSVNKQNIFWTHLTIFTSVVTKLMFPTGLAYEATGQAIVMSKLLLGECKHQYQTPWPENCEKTKFVTQSCEWNFLNVVVCNFRNLYIFLIYSSFLIRFSRRYSFVEGNGTAVNVNTW